MEPIVPATSDTPDTGTAQGDEALANPVIQPSGQGNPAGDSATADANGDATSGADNQTQPNQWETRYKDLQRAHSKQIEELKSAKAKLEIVEKLGLAQQRKSDESQAEYKARIDKLKEDAVTNPGVLVDHINQMMAAQHQFIQQSLANLREEQEQNMLKHSPEWEALQSDIALIDQVPGMQNAPASVKAQIVGLLKSQGGGNGSKPNAAPRPMGSPAGASRIAVQSTTEPSKREVWGAYLRASGALKDNTNPNIIKFSKG